MPVSSTIVSAGVKANESSAWSNMNVFPLNVNATTVCAEVFSGLPMPPAIADTSETSTLSKPPKLINVCTLSVLNVRVSLFAPPWAWLIIAHWDAVFRLANPVPFAAVST